MKHIQSQVSRVVSLTVFSLTMIFFVSGLIYAQDQDGDTLPFDDPSQDGMSGPMGAGDLLHMPTISSWSALRPLELPLGPDRMDRDDSVGSSTITCGDITGIVQITDTGVRFVSRQDDYVLRESVLDGTVERAWLTLHDNCQVGIHVVGTFPIGSLGWR